MSGTAGPAAKVCMRCGQDCSAKPRVKDPQGRYTCQSCVDALPKPRPNGAAKAPSTAKPAPPPKAPPPSEDDGVFTLVDEVSPEAKPKVCGGCGRPMPGDAVVCIGCGFNTATGAQTSLASEVGVAKPVGIARKCSKCGYDMAGLKSPKCPECGTLAIRKTKREIDEEESARVTKWAYLKPLILIAIGLAGILAIASKDGGVEGVLTYGVLYAIEVPIGLVVFWICSAIWIGFDEPFHMTALRLAAVYAIADLASMIMVTFLPLPVAVWLLPLAVYILMLVDMLEIEYVDAVIYALITFVVKLGLVIFALAALRNFF